jgi:pimeloyl-ACP methyl ester carboxylesterase
MQSDVITLANQEKLYYEEHGSEFIGQSPSLLFVHGNFSTCEWWHDTINHLKHLKRHLIALDLPGCGKSSFINPCIRFLDWAQDLKEFCQLRGIAKCVAIGWSFGGGISLKLAEIAPELVSKIILTCTVSDKGYMMISEGKPCQTREEIAESQMYKFTSDLMGKEDAAALTQLYDNLLFKFIKDFPQEKKDIVVRGAFKQRCYLELMETMANSDIDVSKIKAEVLLKLFRS